MIPIFYSAFSLFVVKAERCCAGGRQLYQNQHSKQTEALIVEQFIPKQENITEKNSMDRLFGILPVRKSELVIGRYVFVLAMGLLSLIISLIAQPLVLKVLGETVGVFDIVTAAIAGVFLFALYTVFQIPGYYKYGSIKGRVFMYIPVAGFLVTLLLLSKMPAIGNSIISSVESSPILPVLIVFFSIVAMYAVSIILSIRIMKKKEM